MSSAQKYQFIFTLVQCGHIFVPNGCYLILNFISAKSFVEGMHDFVSLVTTSSPVKAGHDHFLCAGQVCGPSHPEPEIWLLTAGARVSTGYERIKSVVAIIPRSELKFRPQNV